MERHNEDFKFNLFSNLFKKPMILKKDQLGAYHDKLAFYTESDGSDVIKHNVYIKVKIIEVYNQLVEIEVLDVSISDSASQDIINLVKNNIPKYVNPKNVKWQVL